MLNRQRRLLIGIGILVAAGAAVFTFYIKRGANWLEQNANSEPGIMDESVRLAEAYGRLNSASRETLEIVHDDGYPRGVMGAIPAHGDTLVEKARNYLESNITFYRLDDPVLDLEVLRSTESSVTFFQTYKGVRVYAGEIVVLVDGDTIIASIGRLLPAGLELEVRPGLTPGEALLLAAAELGLGDVAIRGNPELLVFDPGVAGVGSEQAVLAWRILVGGDRPLELVLHASDGTILREIDRLEGHTGPYVLDLQDALNTNSWASNCYSESSAVGGSQSAGTETGVFPMYQNDPEALEGWQISQLSWLYYHNNYGLHSYDGLGGTVATYFRSNTLGTASYSPDCDLIQFNEGAIVPDIYAHEFSHWVDAYHADLIYQDESGALDESFGDINGAMLDGNWLVAEGAPDGPFRDMSNPNALNSPDHKDEFYTLGNCPGFGKDNGCVHYNSGIPNYVAYLLAEGGTHPDSGAPVESIGSGVVGSLHFLVMTTGLPSNATFMDARNAAITIAEANWGLPVACKVQNAWFAVGYGKPDYDCDGESDSLEDADQDGVIDSLDNCDDLYNPDQIDHDQDGVGAPCDPDDQLGDPSFLCPTPFGDCNQDDWDEDGILNVDDNCMFTPNPDQADVDEDGEGDACDPDSDGDGISDNDDNCINTPNPDQANADGDFAGDVCDPTPTCDDVYAWSASNTITIGEEIIQTEPQPIADPFACPPDILLDGVPWLDEKPEIDPNGEPHRVELVRAEDPLSAVPLPVCGPTTPGGSPSDIRQVIQIESSSIAHLSLVNNLQEVKDEIRDAGMGEDHVGALTFTPRGGESYYLLLDLGGLMDGDRAALSLRVDCSPRDPGEPLRLPEVGDPIIRPDPSTDIEPSSTPRSTQTLISSATPTFVPIEVIASDTPRPTPMPPPTSTPRPSPRPTDTPQRSLPTATPRDGRG